MLLNYNKVRQPQYPRNFRNCRRRQLSSKGGESVETKQHIGKVIQVIGPVVDVEFPPEQLPEIYNAVQNPRTIR